MKLLTQLEEQKTQMLRQAGQTVDQQTKGLESGICAALC